MSQRIPGFRCYTVSIIGLTILGPSVVAHAGISDLSKQIPGASSPVLIQAMGCVARRHGCAAGGTELNKMGWKTPILGWAALIQSGDGAATSDNREEQ